MLRGQWAISLDAALNWFPVIARWVETGDFSPLNAQERPTAGIFSYVSPKGRTLNAFSDDGQNPEPDSVAVISVVGEMVKYGSLCAYGSDEYAGMINQALSNKNVVGAIIEIDSPGGEVASVAPLQAAIRAHNKPVVAFADMAASAGYWLASATDFIMAQNNISAYFGSIGVMVSFADFSKYYEEKGIKLHEIYADQSTHKNKYFHEALKGNYKAIKSEMLNPLAERFIAQVKQARGAKLNTQVEGILAGKMFFADDALKHGLIDGIGTMQEAIAKVRQLATVKNFMSNP